MDQPTLEIISLMPIIQSSFISVETLQNALVMFGYPAVILFIFIESTGIPFPGETMLLLASFYAAVDHRLQIPIVIACAALGAIVGDNLGYHFGKTGGRALMERFGHILRIKPSHMKRAELFFQKHGNKTVFFGRFISVLRTWAAFLAGMHRMDWRTFMIYNATGGILWALLVGLFGFYMGGVFQNNFAEVEHLAKRLGWISTLIIIAVCLVVGLIIWLRRKRHLKELA